MKNVLTIILTILLTYSQSAFSQTLTANADLRAIFEERHGYGSLFYDSLKAGNYISQRTRININYQNNKLKLKLAPQNVRVWGDVTTTSKNDSSTSMHEAWAEYQLNSRIYIKVGRQELNYDDARILGNVDWTMAARSHDLALLKIRPDTTSFLHLGLAINASKEISITENYLQLGQYKYAHLLWYHKDLKNLGISLLVLNQGFPFLDSTNVKIAWNQTSGGRFNWKKKSLNLELSTYIQTGEIAKNTVSAWYAQGNCSYTFKNHYQVLVGAELLSGKSINDKSTKIKSFNPWYGTNHKFNGFMDYFYVNNHKNSVGLIDLFLSLTYQKNKLKIILTPHYFMSAATLY
ncbi:MAG: alginate export family protein, partial [Bacteroidota bacterium]|nr:alginate export family protein [Bacteroidota bacterium]